MRFIKKRILLLIVGTVLIICSGCSETATPEGRGHDYGLNEKCENEGVFIKINSLKFSSYYQEFITEVIPPDGQYMLLDIDTNLTEEEFDNPANEAILYLSEQHSVTLKYLFTMYSGKRLVYEIPSDSEIGDSIFVLKTSDKKEGYPYVKMKINAMDSKTSVGEVVERNIVIRLEQS